MTLKSFIFSLALLLGGLVAGMIISDAATYYGFPHKPYWVKLVYVQSAESSFNCMQLTTVTDGVNFSYFDEQSKDHVQNSPPFILFEACILQALMA
jgi:hypothetical protein